jgi:hypothetical protein
MYGDDDPLSALDHQHSLMGHQIDERSARERRFIGAIMSSVTWPKMEFFN